MLSTHASAFDKAFLMDITIYEQAVFNLVRSSVCSGTLTLDYAFWFWKVITSAIAGFVLDLHGPDICYYKDPMSFFNWMMFYLISFFVVLALDVLIWVTLGKPLQGRKAIKKFADNNAKEIDWLERELWNRKRFESQYKSQGQAPSKVD